MGAVWWVVRVGMVAIIVVAVGEISKRQPRYGALLLSLPMTSILAFLLSWYQHHDLRAVSQMARETLILVPLGLPFFMPFVLASRWGLGFWHCFIAGAFLSSLTIGAWLWLGARSDRSAADPLPPTVEQSARPH